VSEAAAAHAATRGSVIDERDGGICIARVQHLYVLRMTQTRRRMLQNRTAFGLCVASSVILAFRLADLLP